MTEKPVKNLTDLATAMLRKRMAGVMKVSEFKNDWLKGTLTSDPTVVVEISFETPPGNQSCWPGTYISYLGMWRHPRLLCEFQLGVMCTIPDDDAWTSLRPVLARLQKYRPIRIALR